MCKVENLLKLKEGETVKFKTNLFGREREVCGSYVYFCNNDTGWMIYLKNYTVEGILIDDIGDEPQGFPTHYGVTVYYLHKN